VIIDPVTFSPDKTVRDAIAVMKRHNISGLPIVDDKGALLGIITGRDIRFESNLDRLITECMTKENLVTAPKGTTLNEARQILQEHRIEKLLIVEEGNLLAGMVTVKDILMKEKHPNASLDTHYRLMVAAAVGATDDLLQRVSALVDSGVDVLVLDSAHGHAQGVLDGISSVKKDFSHLPLIAGNVATAEGTRALIDHGADAVKVGQGAGASCTTRIIAGIGVPQLTAVLDCVEEASKSDIPVISDGGIRFSGDLAKAMAAGADCVMLGSILAGLDESPGEIILHEGRQYKAFRGMGSLGPMKEGSADRYFQEGEENIKLVPEGVEGLVPYRGNLRSTVYQMIGGLRASMGYCGAKDTKAMQKETDFVRISSAGYSESHPHDVKIVKEAPNYQAKDRS
jgi:IMP dehydrogenase